MQQARDRRSAITITSGSPPAFGPLRIPCGASKKVGSFFLIDFRYLSGMEHRILLIESDDSFAAKLSTFLESMGFRIVRSKKGLEGVQLLFEVSPSLVVVDQDLIDIPGNRICEMIKSSLPNRSTPIILMAGAEMIESLSKIDRKKRADETLRKPFDPMDLYSMVVTRLEMVKSEKEAGQAIVERIINNVAKPTPGPTETKKRAAPGPEGNGSIGPENEKRSAFEMIGSLERIPIPRLIHTLLKARLTGILTLSHQDHRIDIHVSRGKPTLLRSNYIPKLTLGSLLVETGQITDREKETVWQVAAKEGLKFGSKLVSMGLLQEENLDRLLVRQSREKLLWLFDDDWRPGEYHFYPAAEKPPDFLKVESEPGALILDGVRRYYTPERIDTFFQRKNRMEALIHRLKTHPHNIARMGLSKWETRLLASLASGYTPTDLIAAAGGDRVNALKFLYALLVMDILTLKAAPRDPKAPDVVRH